ncbi:MAG: trypsin-like peptidase domain-containing protein, partial [Rhizobacter sp.]|nr:trypsin-like peptidase domain-containing protein [Bacteriovorax sp.]
KFIALFALILSAQIAAAAEPAFDIFTTYSPSVVLIQTKLNATGTGFFVTPGLLLTNRHVVRSFNKRKGQWDAPKAIVLKDGREITKFNSVYCSVRVDVCAISIAPQTTIKTFAKLSIVPSKVGQDVYVMGHPQGISNPIISSGIVSSENFLIPGLDHKGKEIVFKGFTTTAAVSPGSSGSPVLNRQGEILGIAVSILRGAQNLNVIIGSEELSMFAKQIAKHDTESVFTIPGMQTPNNFVSL